MYDLEVLCLDGNSYRYRTKQKPVFNSKEIIVVFDSGTTTVYQRKNCIRFIISKDKED